MSVGTEQGDLRVMMGKASDMPPSMMIEIVPKNAISVEQRIANELSGEGRLFRESITLNGAEAIQLVHRASQSIGEDSLSLYFDRGAGYVHVSAPIYLNPFYDYPTDVLLRSFTLLPK